MQILFELSKEHPTLPYAEIKACLNTYNINYEEIYHNGIFVIEVKERVNWKKISHRIAMSHSINEIVGYSVEEMLDNVEIESSFKVEGGNFELRKKIGKEILEKTGKKVNLEGPDVIIKIFDANRIYFCREIAGIDRSSFEKRRPSQRPFSHPTSMHPRIARVLVNLTGVKEKEILADPFCGGGGILIEAGLIGARIIGVDVKKKLIEGCKKNLEYYGIKDYELYNADMNKIDFEEVNAVATDFPYGRASHLSDKIDKLYKNSIKKISEITSKAVIGLPSLNFTDEIEKYFDVEQIHCARVHRSLIRFFYVLKS
ncbi:MAG TPA: hypothetical protein ENI53_02030 [Thermoplasmatales archaeon]|nr:hypothetical protein [Thermoplasmatales archaeon]